MALIVTFLIGTVLFLSGVKHLVTVHRCVARARNLLGPTTELQEGHRVVVEGTLRITENYALTYIPPGNESAIEPVSDAYTLPFAEAFVEFEPCERHSGEDQGRVYLDQRVQIVVGSRRHRGRSFIGRCEAVGDPPAEWTCLRRIQR